MKLRRTDQTQDIMYPTVTLKPEADQPIAEGYPRVLQKQVARRDELSPGCVADVLDSDGTFIGRGLVNPYCRILVRMLSYDAAQPVDQDFFYQRLLAAKTLRDRGALENSYRAVFSESDGLPGLIADRFEDYLICQIGTLGMDIRREMLFDMLQDIYRPLGIFEKSSSGMRKPEKLSPRIEQVFGVCPPLIRFRQNDLTFLNDLEEGQKTGFFLDQRNNREAASHYIEPGARVLDGFCYTGGFSLLAARVEGQVTAFDVSERALDIARRAAAENGLQDRCDFRQADAFEQLRQLEDAGATFDVVILDPPAFARHRGVLPNALRGYRVVNRRALRLLSEGGILVSCSCTQQVTEAMFLEMLQEAAHDARRAIRFLEIRGQPFDHPVLATLPETRYLKCVIAQAG